MIDWKFEQQHRKVVNWICLSNFLKNEIRYLWQFLSEEKSVWIFWSITQTFFYPFGSHSIMERCLLFTFPKMNSTEGWNIWWSTWPNKLCNYPLDFLSLCSLHANRFSPFFSFLVCWYLITNCTMKRKEVTRTFAVHYPCKNIKLLKRFLLIWFFCFLMLCLHLVFLFDDKIKVISVHMSF